MLHFAPLAATVRVQQILPVSLAQNLRMPLRQAPIRPVAGWRFRAERPGADVLGWLLDPGSLTARLMARAHGRFRVRVTRLAWLRPTLAEARELKMSVSERALIREVVLEGEGEPWVIARSVIPRSSLAGRNRQLRRLGSRPLGAFLFRDPTLQRQAVHLVKMGRAAPTPDTRPEPAAANSVGPAGTVAAACRLEASIHTVWGRRSTFILRGHPLLVAEYFLPALTGPTDGTAASTNRLVPTGPHSAFAPLNNKSAKVCQ